MKNALLILSVYLFIGCQNNKNNRLTDNSEKALSVQNNLNNIVSSNLASTDINELPKTDNDLLNNTVTNFCIVKFSSFDAWKQNTTTKKMKFVRTINQGGTISINKGSNDVIVSNSETGEKELLSFFKLEKQDMGHVIGFGDINSELMFNFIPEDKLLLIKINDVMIFKFSLSLKDTQSIKTLFD